MCNFEFYEVKSVFVVDKKALLGTIHNVLLNKIPMKFLVCRGSSVVERQPEELGVGGSIPPPGTILR